MTAFAAIQSAECHSEAKRGIGSAQLNPQRLSTDSQTKLRIFESLPPVVRFLLETQIFQLRFSARIMPHEVPQSRFLASLRNDTLHSGFQKKAPLRVSAPPRCNCFCYRPE